MVVSDGLRDRCATVKRFYTAASLATIRFAAPMMADDARDRRTTRLIKGVTLSTLLSLIFAPAQECQCPTHYYNQTNRKQRRIAVLGVKHEQRRDDEAAHKQSRVLGNSWFSADVSFPIVVDIALMAFLLWLNLVIDGRAARTRFHQPWLCSDCRNCLLNWRISRSVDAACRARSDSPVRRSANEPITMDARPKNAITASK